MSDATYKIKIIDAPFLAVCYKKILFDAQDSRAGEPLVKLSDFGIACDDFAGRSSIEGHRVEGTTKFVWARRTVAEKLVRANKGLCAQGVEIFVRDAYRPIAVQEGFWHFYTEQARERLPQASEEERLRYVSSLVADPTGFSTTDSTTWPVHACGGAVDVTLRSLKTGERLEMDWDSPLNETARSDAFERKLRTGEIAPDYPCLVNRRLLHWAMEQQGFINYPLEFWHFDYGDQMYVLNAQNLGLPDAPQTAWYGYVGVPEGDSVWERDS
jgi:D-alanyl-D-alanine dipeptidase